MIERAVYQLLLADAGIVAVVGSSVGVDLVEDPVSPYLVVSLVSGRRPLFIDLTPRQKTALIQIDIYALDSEQVRDLAELIIALFHGKSASADGHDIQLILLENEPIPSYESETGLRRLITEFRFNYH